MENTMKMYVTADEAAQILGVSRGYILLIIPLRLSAICRRAHFVFYQKTFSKNF